MTTRAQDVRLADDALAGSHSVQRMVRHHGRTHFDLFSGIGGFAIRKMNCSTWNFMSTHMMLCEGWKTPVRLFERNGERFFQTESGWTHPVQTVPEAVFEPINRDALGGQRADAPMQANPQSAQADSKPAPPP